MADLKALYEELNFPSEARLLQVARRRGIPTARADDIIKEKTVGQLFQKSIPQRGHISATGPNARWQDDLIDFQQYFKNFKRKTKAPIMVWWSWTFSAEKPTRFR